MRTARPILVAALLALPVALAAAPVAPAPAPAVPVPAAKTEAVMERGRALTKAFYAVDLGPVWAAFTPELQAASGGLDAFRAYREAGVETYGAESKLLGERVVPLGAWLVYVRTAVFEKHPEQAWNLIWAFNDDGTVALFSIEADGGASPAGGPAGT